MGNDSKPPSKNFKWIKYTSKFNKDFIKNYNEEIDEGYFCVKLMFTILKNYMNLQIIYYFNQK